MRDLYRVNKRKRGNSVRFVYNTLKNNKGAHAPPCFICVYYRNFFSTLTTSLTSIGFATCAFIPCARHF